MLTKLLCVIVFIFILKCCHGDLKQNSGLQSARCKTKCVTKYANDIEQLEENYGRGKLKITIENCAHVPKCRSCIKPCDTDTTDILSCSDLCAASQIECLVSCLFLADSDIHKSGRCPVQSNVQNFGVECTQECRNDGQCPDVNKCCKVGCGYTCVKPEYSRHDGLNPVPQNVKTSERRQGRAVRVHWDMPMGTNNASRRESTLFVVQMRRTLNSVRGIPIWNEKSTWTDVKMIDCNVLLMMDDDTLKTYLPAYGDRLAATAFCRTRSPTGQSSSNNYGNALKELRANWKSHGGQFKSGNTSAKKTTRRIELGWMDYHIGSRDFKQVRQKFGGGVRHLRVEKSLQLSELLNHARETFFPLGKSKRGTLGDFDIQLKDFQGTELNLDKNITELYDESKLKILRVYLYTKKKTIEQETQLSDNSGRSSPTLETSDEDIELGTPTVVTNRRRYMELCQETDIELPVLRHRRRLNSTGQLTSTPSVETSSTHCMREQDVTCSREQPVGEICSNQSVGGSTIEQPFNDSSGEQIVSDSSVDCIREEPVNNLNTEQTGEQLTSEQRSDSNIGSNTDDNALKNWIKNVLWGVPQTIVVQRDRLMQTTLRIVCKQSFSWTSPFRVVFSGEIGDDMGGPRREFMWLLTKAIGEAILYGPDGNKVFIHDGDKLETKMYETCGKLTGYILLNGGPGLPMINTILYAFMTEQCIQQNLDVSKIPSTDDLTYIDEILKCSNSDDFQKTIDKHFETIIDQGLQPMKCQFEKKGEVVTYLLKNAIYYRHHAEISQFVKGLNSVGFLYDEMLREPQAFLSFFTDQDSKTLDFDSFRRLYKVNFSAEGSNNRIQEKDTIYCFETFLMDCTEAESKVTLQDVLLFWTGANSVPPLGFDKSFEINFVTAADKRLPVAHTCGMILELVRGISDADLFKNDMIKAIKWSGGFHLC